MQDPYKKQKIESKKNLKLQKRMRKVRTIKFIFKTLIIIALLSGLIAFGFTSPMFNITGIDVVGNEKIEKDEYINLSKLNIGANIFNFSKVRAILDIKSNAYVESVRIKRKLPSKIEIKVEERTVTYLIPLPEEEFAYINNQGYILEKSKEKLPLTIITGISTKTENIISGNRLENYDLEKLQNVIQIKDAMNSIEVNKELTTIDITNKYNYILTFEKEAKEVQLGSINDLSSKVLFMKYIIEDQEGVPGTIYLNQEQNYFSPK